MQAIDELQKLGYTLTIDRDEIVVKHTGQGHPDPGTVKPLLDELRQRKREALVYLLFKPINDELCRLWQAGTREWIEQHRPELAQEIDQAETRLNAAWLDCEDGTGDLDGFKEALATWRQANLKAIRGYNDTRALGGVIAK